MRTYCPNYIDKEIYKRVLSVAKSYYDDLNKIKQIESDYLYISSSKGSVKSGSISDPTYSKMIQIEKHTKVLKYRTDAVKNTLKVFSNEEKDVLIQNIVKGIPMIYCNTQKSERSIQRLRHSFVMLLATELGEVL